MQDFTNARIKAFKKRKPASDEEISKQHDKFHKGWMTKNRHLQAAENFNLDLLDKEYSYYRTLSKQDKRKFCRWQQRERAALAIACGAVGGSSSISRITGRQLSQQIMKNNSKVKFYRTQVAVGKNGEKLSSKSQHVQKMAEFKAVCRGIQAEALKLNMVCTMVVVTAPPEYHPNPSNGNCTWNGVQPDELFDLWQKEWKKLRVYFERSNIPLIGIWSRETNKDATPHLNYILWHKEDDLPKIEKLFNDTMRLGGTHIKQIIFKKIELKLKYENNKFSDVTNYISKGFAIKHINYNTIGTVNPITPDEKYALEEQHLASSFAYRRWGFLGIPKLTTYRNLRSLSKIPDTTKFLEALYESARKGDFAKFIELCGGLGVSEKKRTFENVYQVNPSDKRKVVIGIREKATNAELITK